MVEWADQIARMMRETVNASVEAAVKFQKQTWQMVDELIQHVHTGFKRVEFFYFAGISKSPQIIGEAAVLRR